MVHRDKLTASQLCTQVLAVALALMLVGRLSALKSVVSLTDGGSPEIRKILGKRLTDIVNSLEDQEWQSIADYFTESGLESFKDLVEKTACKNINPLYETKLLDLVSGGYEVRDIKVKLDMKKGRGNPYQYMVFAINKEGLVDDVRFAMERFHYDKIIKEGERLQDFAYRQQILQFIEIFRTAYNRKDLNYLKKVYSEDALIIVGRVLKAKTGEADYLEQLPQQRIKYIRLSKKEYIKRLERIFKGVTFLKVNFKEVTITRHPKIPVIYGVTLKQYWRTPNYEDEGYLFLMVDFRDMNNPLIHVRSWQPEKFPDGSVVSLGDFEII